MVLGYFIVHKGGLVNGGVNKSYFGPSLITACWGGRVPPLTLEALQLLFPGPHQSFYPELSFLGTEFSGPASGIPRVTAVMPTATLRQTCGVQGQCSRAKIWSHLEHRDSGAASSQINARFDREILQESSWERGERERMRKERGQRKRATDSPITSHSLWWGRTWHVVIPLKLDRFLQFCKVLKQAEFNFILQMKGFAAERWSNLA